jgi:hypothetical protein
MGTSSSYRGPTRTPLLPPWAQEPTSGEAPPTQPDETPLPDGVPPAPPLPLNLPITWNSAKRRLGGFAAAGGGLGLARAAQSYVRARGGASAAARAAPSGRRSSARLARFLSDVATLGVDEAVRALPLEHIVGQPAEAVLAAIADILAPDGATLEEAASRQMVEEVFIYLYERYGLEEGGLARLDAMDGDGVREALCVSVASYIYQRWLQELGDRIEQRAMSPRDAFRLERQVKDYVNDAVRFDLSQCDVLVVSWGGPEGQQIIGRIYADAYALLEAAE